MTAAEAIHDTLVLHDQFYKFWYILCVHGKGGVGRDVCASFGALGRRVMWNVDGNVMERGKQA